MTSSPFVKLNHIGIAVRDLPEMVKLFSILGLFISHTEEVTDQKVMTHFMPLPNPAPQLEFLEPTQTDSTIAQFIHKRGPGIHHLSFEVQKGKLDKLLLNLKTNGYRLIYDSPKSGAHDMRINFIHPASCGGILIELMEPIK